MKKSANSKEVGTPVEDKAGFVVIKLIKGETAETDKLESIIYIGSDGKFTEEDKVEGTNLNDVVNDAFFKAVGKGLKSNDVSIVYHHELVHGIVAQEIQDSKLKFINDIQSLKTEYESMKSNNLIEFSEDQMNQIECGIKVLDKVLNKLGGE